MLLSGPGGNLLMSIYVVSNQFIPLPPHGQSPVSLLTHKALLSRLPASNSKPQCLLGIEVRKMVQDCRWGWGIQGPVPRASAKTGMTAHTRISHV